MTKNTRSWRPRIPTRYVTLLATVKIERLIWDQWWRDWFVSLKLRTWRALSLRPSIMQRFVVVFVYLLRNFVPFDWLYAPNSRPWHWLSCNSPSSRLPYDVVWVGWLADGRADLSWEGHMIISKRRRAAIVVDVGVGGDEGWNVNEETVEPRRRDAGVLASLMTDRTLQ